MKIFSRIKNVFTYLEYLTTYDTLTEHNLKRVEAVALELKSLHRQFFDSAAIMNAVKVEGGATSYNNYATVAELASDIRALTAKVDTLMRTIQNSSFKWSADSE